MSIRVGSLCGVPCAIGSFVISVLSLATPALAGPIAVDNYYEFGFDDLGTLATGCDPADPAGAFCSSSSGTPTTFLDAPAWTFTSGATGSTLTVTDAFVSGDRFQIFDFGVSIGFTSASGTGVDCGDDPVPCLADPNISHGAFGFASGAHSITIGVAEGGFGVAYLLLQDGGAPVPEPATLLLLATGAGVTLYRRRQRPGTH
jgi:PEP-CTERM motif-containing protein